MLMTEDQIERRVERLMDRLDAMFLRGSLSQVEYDDAVKELNEWAEREYATMRKPRED